MAAPPRAAQIVATLPPLYFQDPLLRRVVDASAGRLAEAQLDLQRVMNAHWADTADDSATAALGQRPLDLAGFDHVSIGQLEKAETAEGDVAVAVTTGVAEVTTAVRLTVTLAGNPTPIGTERGVQAAGIQPQIETLVRGFVESPNGDSGVRLSDLIAFVEQGSGLFTVKPLPDSFLVAEHLATGQVDRNVDVVTLGEKERAELKALILTLSV